MKRRARPLPAALAIVAVIGAGCSDDRAESGSAGSANAGQEPAVKFAGCMREHGVRSSRTRTRRVGGRGEHGG
jgi:hypothetical protein